MTTIAIPLPTRSIDLPPTRTATDDQVSGAGLLAALEAAVESVANVEPDALGSALPRGRALLDLAALGREAVAVLTGRPGTVVTAAPGVVVVRELVAVTRLLSSAVSGTPAR